MNFLSRARLTRAYSNSARALPAPRVLDVIFPALCFVLFLIPGAAEAQTRYKIIHIPTPDGFDSTALGLNDAGYVVGYSYKGDDANAFVYKYPEGSITDLGSLGGRATVATAINQSNEIVGYSADSSGNVLAFLYTGSITSLGTLKDGSNSEAFAINISGQAAGDSQSDGDNHRPVLFSGDGVKDLGASTKNSETLKTAYGINASGQIVGRSDTDGGTVHGFLFTDNRLTDLGTLGGGNSEALAINRVGTVVGDSETSNGATHAFVFKGGILRDLGTLPAFEKASFARAINNQGQIVGDSESDNQKRAFVYTNGQFNDLTRAAINMREAGFSALDVADGINSQGWIVGFGTTLDGQVAAFLAIPVGVTNDPPGGVNTPVANSGSVGGFVELGGGEPAIVNGGIVGGWFCPPTLWRFGWHYHFIWRRPPHWRDHWNDWDHDHDKGKDHDKDHDKDKDHGKDKGHDKDKDHDGGKDHDVGKNGKPVGHHEGGKPGEHHEDGKPGRHHEEGTPGEHHEGGKPGEHHEDGTPSEHHEGGKPGEHHEEGKPSEHHEEGKPGEHHEGGKPGEHHEGGEPGEHHEGGRPPEHHEGGRKPPEHHPAPANKPTPSKKKK